MLTSITPLKGSVTTALFLSFILAACGGGGGTADAEGMGAAPNAGGSSGTSPSSGTGNSSNTAASTALTILADSTHTAAGSANITLHVVGASANDAAQWTLDPQDPGRLDRTSGDTVTYIPPATDAAASGNTIIPIRVTVGQASAVIEITLVATPEVAEGATPVANPVPETPADTTVPDVAGVFGVIAQRERTPAGGDPITLTASKPVATGTVSWSLEPGSVGSLSSTSGDSVQYIPPAAGSLANNVAAVINATMGGVTKKTTVFVEGTNGLHLLAGNDYGSGIVNASGTAARFSPQFMTRDAQGNLYVIVGRTIRKITPEGSVTTLAGATSGYGLGDGTGTQADFVTPRGITIDDAGNLYVANTYTTANYRYAYSIRKITPAGEVTTLANTVIQRGEPRHSNLSGIAVDRAGNVYVSDTKVYRDITKITPAGAVSNFASGQWTAPVETRLLNLPRDPAFDPLGNLYVLDSGTDYYLRCGADCNYYAAAIRKVSPDGTVTAFAGPVGPILAGGPTSGPPRDGTGTDARFTAKLSGMAIDQAGNIYVTDDDSIRRITPDAVVTTLATRLPESGNMWLAIDPAGKLYITSSLGIRERGANGGLVTLAGGTVPTVGERNDRGAAALFNGPRGVAADAAGNLYVADERNNAVRKVTPAGDVSTFYKAPADATQATNVAADINGRSSLYSSNRMVNVAVDADGNVYVDSLDGIRKISPAGVASIVAPSTKSNALATDGAGNLYSIELFSSTIQKITRDGAITTIAPSDPAQSLDAQGLALDKDGNFYILSYAGVWKMTPDGTVTLHAAAPEGRAATITNPFASSVESLSRFTPQSITIDDEGNVYAAYTKGADAMIRRITPQGSASVLYSYSADEVSTGNHFMPKGIAMAGPRRIAVTSANAVFQLKF